MQWRQLNHSKLQSVKTNAFANFQCTLHELKNQEKNFIFRQTIFEMDVQKHFHFQTV